MTIHQEPYFQSAAMLMLYHNQLCPSMGPFGPAVGVQEGPDVPCCQLHVARFVYFGAGHITMARGGYQRKGVLKCCMGAIFPIA